MLTEEAEAASSESVLYLRVADIAAAHARAHVRLSPAKRMQYSSLVIDGIGDQFNRPAVGGVPICVGPSLLAHI